MPTANRGEGSSVNIDLSKGDVIGATETQTITTTKMNWIALLSKGELGILSYEQILIFINYDIA